MKNWKHIFGAILALMLIVGASSIPWSSAVRAATNIYSTTTQHYAWDDFSGWWDLYSSNTVRMNGMRLTGYASSSIGEISFDCATSPSGNICGYSNYGVCNGLAATHNTDGTCTGYDWSGLLTGYAWNDKIGWISFSCRNQGATACTASNYGVSVDPNTGIFSGYAWNDTIGWISFNCGDVSGRCTTSNYGVLTTYIATSSIAYVDSAIIDTQIQGGATLNSITWSGTKNANGTAFQTWVDFQIASSNNAAGPFTFMGPDGTSIDYYSASCASNYKGGHNLGGDAPMNTPICIDPAQVVNKRYLKYRVRLRSDVGQTDTPRIDSIILNWSS